MTTPDAATLECGEAIPQHPTLINATTELKFEEQAKLSQEVLSTYQKEQKEQKEKTSLQVVKRIESLTGEIFRNHLKDTLSELEYKEAERVVFESNMAGVVEGSSQFFTLITTKCKRMALCRNVVKLVLQDETMTTGFTKFDRALIVGCANISEAYDAYYLAWMEAVQHPALLRAVESTDEATLASRATCQHLLSPYTMIRVRSAKPAKKQKTTQIEPGKGVESFQFECEPYAVFFAQVLGPVLRAFDVCIASLRAIKPDDPMVLFLAHYRLALSETDPEQLEKVWNVVDRKWMDCKHEIQVVHDIEDGYSDPLRAKQGPDFSLRFLDSTYAKQNTTIKDIQSLICDYYQTRDTKLSKDGLQALASTMAGIYYIPFKTGCSLVFSYSGQSIPNRLDVKKEKGVKIYFDAVETAARVEQVKVKVAKIFANAKTEVLDKYKPDAVEQLVWHVAAHEVGHAIYGTSNLEPELGPETCTLLEEPRAELTAMFTLRLLYQRKVISLDDVSKYLVQFALDSVRYFSKFESQPMQPYIIFHVHFYNICYKHKFLQLTKSDSKEDQIVIDATHTLDVLDDLSDLFERFLDHLDDGGSKGKEGLENILESMRKPSDFVKTVVRLCNC